MERDQSEDRGQSNNIVFGFSAYAGAPTNYGVVGRNGITQLSASPSAARAVRAAIEFDKADAAEAEALVVRDISETAVTPEEDEAFATIPSRFMRTV